MLLHSLNTGPKVALNIHLLTSIKRAFIVIYETEQLAVVLFVVDVWE